MHPHPGVTAKPLLKPEYVPSQPLRVLVKNLELFETHLYRGYRFHPRVSYTGAEVEFDTTRYPPLTCA
jgi:hypothetical protein